MDKAMDNQRDLLSKADIFAAISKVEKAHNYSLQTISDYIDKNEESVIAGFSCMTKMNSIDQKFSQIEDIFSDHPEFGTHAPFLVEVAALV